MVTRPRTPSPAAARPRRLRGPRARLAAALAPWLAAALLGAALLAAGAPPAAAQTRTLYFLTFKSGVTDASGSGETIFDQLDTVGGHGALLNGRSAKTTAVELDIYGVSREAHGLGIGIEVLQYDKTFNLQDGERVRMQGKGVLFTLKYYLRLGNVFPFAGLGIGNYYLNYSQANAGVRFRDSPDAAYTSRLGVRMLYGRWGLLLEAGQNYARLPVLIPGDAGPASIELGGRYRNVGISYAF
jgi:hypothetical protein